MSEHRTAQQSQAVPPASGGPITDADIQTIWTDPWGLEPRTGAPAHERLPAPGSRGVAPSQGLGDDCSDDW
jgi:hypothetical protein